MAIVSPINTDPVVTQSLLEKVQRIRSRRFKEPTVGCEFTAAGGPKYDDEHDDGYENQTRLENRIKNALPCGHWIISKVHWDNGMLEAPTPVCKNLSELEKMWTDFDEVVRKYKLSYHDRFYDSGSGHLHLSMPSARKPIRDSFESRFIHNMFVQVIDNPWTIWGFNKFLDNVNACLPLTNEYVHKYDYSSIKQAQARMMKKFQRGQRYEIHFLGSKISIADELRKFQLIEEHVFSRNEWEPSPWDSSKKVYKATQWDVTLIQDHSAVSGKRHAVIYRPGINTLEFRFFDTPTSLKQLQLHYQVAIGMYRKAWEASNQHQLSQPQRFSKAEQYQELTYAEAIKGLERHAQELGIEPKELTRQKRNLYMRFHPEQFMKGLTAKQLLR